MASITIRKLSDDLKARLSVRGSAIRIISARKANK